MVVGTIVYKRRTAYYYYYYYIYFNMTKSRNKGFTLIELIIGITILALLAVGLLAALDPAEQFAKARDTATRNTLLEVFGALQRYEAAQESYPGDISDTTANPDNTGGPLASRDPGDNSLVLEFDSAIEGLVETGELKANFVNAAGSSLEKIYLFKDLGPDPDPAVNDGKIMLCYRPTSKSFQLQGGLFDAAANVGTATAWAAGSFDTAPTTGGPTDTCNVAGSDLDARLDCVYCAQ